MLEHFDALIEEVQQWIDRNQPELLNMKKGHIDVYKRQQLDRSQHWR